MRLIRFLAFCAWAAPYLAHADQTGQIMAGSADFSYDLVAHITTDLKSALTTSEIAELGGEIQGEGNRVHRYIVDRTNRTYFGYDLVHEYQGASDTRGLYPVRQRLVGIEPLTITPQPPVTSPETRR